MNDSFAAEPVVSPGVESARETARVRNLATHRIWRLLLHVEESPFGVESRADGPRFFLAESGKEDPSAELMADITALFAPVVDGSQEHFQCRFPARARFLRRELQLDTTSLPAPVCTDLIKFRKDFSAKSLSLVYATANMNEPASMFGHTMLLIGQDDDTPLDDAVVSYVARVTSRGFRRIYEGVLGGFEGLVEVANLAQRLLSYNTRESRNLWSFKLQVDPVDLARMVDHLWEIKSTYFEYFYMDENCSFYNQYFLQVAYPELDIADMGAFSLPIEAVHLVLQVPNLVQEVHFYPAAQNVYRGGLALLTPREQTLVKELTRTPRAVTSPRAAVIYKTALHRHWIHSYADDQKLSDADKDIANELSALLQGSGEDPVITQPDLTNPTIGHAPHTVSLGAGFGPGGGSLSSGATGSAQKPFIALDVRPLLHTLSESPLSYAPFSEIQFLSTALRGNPESGKVWVDQFILGSIYSLNRWGYGLFPRSWSLEFGVRDLWREGRRGSATYAQGELGLTLPLFDRGIISILAGPITEWTPDLTDPYRVGALGEAVFIFYLHDRWTLSARGGVRAYGLPSLSLKPWGEGALNIFLGTYLSLEAKGRYLAHNDSAEGWGMLRFHFF